MEVLRGLCPINSCSASGSQQENMASLASSHYDLFTLACTILPTLDLPNRPAPFLPGAPLLRLPLPFPYLISCRMSEELFSRNSL